MPSNLRRAVRSFVASPIKEEKTYRRLDEPGLALDLAALLERNSLHAKAQGLPTIGSKLLNPHGIEFVVEGHVHVPTASTIQNWRDGKGNTPTDLYPSIIPQNLSPMLMDFIEAVDRCTTKTLLVLDTMPYQRKDSGVPGGHWIDTSGNSGANLLFIDAASIHETHLAHEIGHLWIQYVDQAEDERVLEDASDPARINQLSFVQSFVLDFRVNEIIESRGFDMSIILEDQDQSIASLGRAIQAGYRPNNKREEVFMALTLATHLVESQEDTHLAKVADTLEQVSHLNPEFLALANKLVEAVMEHGYQDRDSIRACIDACLSIAFEHTEDGIDLDDDLVIPSTQDPDFDKYPQWMEGASTDLKCEVGRLMAREAVPSDCNWIISPGTEQTCLVSFKLPNGQILGPWTLNHLYPTSTHSYRRREINEINRQNRESQMKQTQQATSPLYNMPGQTRRFYMAGTGRFLTKVREEEWLGGESAYGYAIDNPVTYSDPSGLAPCSPSPCSTFPGGPCAYAKSKGDDAGDGGGVICCDGKAYPCVWNIGHNPPSLRECAFAHEQRHVKVPGGCPPNSGYGRQVGVGPYPECAPSRQEIRCLIEKRPRDCSKLTGSAKKSCEKAIHDRICQMCNYMIANGCPPSFLPSLCKYC